MKRRTVFKVLMSAVAWFRAAGLRAFADPLPLTDAHIATLRAAARIVLPSALGARGADEVADRFLRWLRGYKSGAEMDHGYGVTRLRTTPPSPAASYPKQLADLGARAAAKGKPFAKLDARSQREIITASLTNAKIDTLPARPNGRHVIADLMAFYFRGTDANDLCYEAAIGKDKCRGLPDSDRAPARLNTRASAGELEAWPAGEAEARPGEAEASHDVRGRTADEARCATRPPSRSASADRRSLDGGGQGRRSRLIEEHTDAAR